MADDKKPPKNLLEVFGTLKKTYGDNSVMWGSEMPIYDVVSTGSLALDYATGIGGYPTNRVVEISGENGTGKTTLALHTINNFLQKFTDRGAIFLDCEHRLTTDWARSFVEDMDRLIVVYPDTIEQATDMYREAVTSGFVSVAVLDSIGGAPTQRVTGKSSEIGNMGGNALGVTAFSNFATTLSGKYNCCTIGINQVRDDMDGYHRVITPGGKAWKHACSLRINLKPGDQKFIDKINGENIQVGYSIVAKVIKNSVAPPHRLGWYCFYNVPSKYGFGIDQAEEAVRLGTLTGVIEVRGGWYAHPALPGGKVQGQGRLIDTVLGDEKIKSIIVGETLSKLKAGEAHLDVSYDPDAETDVASEPKLGREPDLELMSS